MMKAWSYKHHPLTLISILIKGGNKLASITDCICPCCPAVILDIVHAASYIMDI